MAKRKNKRVSKYSLLTSIIIVLVLAIAGMLGIDLPEATQNSQKADYFNSPLCVSYIDVGQGDCSLISCKGVNILVDGGEAENSKTVLKYLKENGIESIDCYILTHPHSDHIGAAINILNNIECKQVFTTYFSEFNIPTSSLFENLINTIYDNAVDLVTVDAGDNFSFGELDIEIIAPIVESDDYNEMSIVFIASYLDTRCLFTGDTTKEVEYQILENGINVDCDVIKIAHHGSTTSNSERFIDAVSPELAIISCGKNNSYGHPHREIISMLEENEIDYLRTDQSGTVVYYGDGKAMKAEVY